MVLSEKQFDILLAIKEAGKKYTQRELHEITNHSLGTINKVVRELKQSGLITDGNITDTGLDSLEPYRVERAIILAAGFGSRMVPVTLNTPKPLIRVNGDRIVDGLIDACLDEGINEIYIVRGYLSEQFDQLLYKYPMIKFIENPYYNVSNNISSIMAARHLLQKSYVIDGDLILYNKKVIRKYQYHTNFLGIYEDRTDDWCFEVDNRIIKEHKLGGLNCYQQIGISYWDISDGARMADDIEKAYNLPGGKELYWEETATRVFKESYNIFIRECSRSDVAEVDTYEDLQKIDPVYVISTPYIR